MFEDNLVGSERIAYRARVHWITYAPAFALSVVAITVFSVAASFRVSSSVVNVVGSLIFIAAFGFGLEAYLRITTSDFTVTDRRVIIQVGYLKRSSLEIFLSKVEGISIKQSFVGRIFNFGDISIRGGGGIQEDFQLVAAPYLFRRHVQLLADAIA